MNPGLLKDPSVLDAIEDSFLHGDEPKTKAHAWRGPRNLPVADQRKRRRREQRQARRRNRAT